MTSRLSVPELVCSAVESELFAHTVGFCLLWLESAECMYYEISFIGKLHRPGRISVV